MSTFAGIFIANDKRKRRMEAIKENNGYFFITLNREDYKRDEIIQAPDGENLIITSFPYKKWYLGLLETVSFGLFKFGWNYWVKKVKI